MIAYGQDAIETDKPWERWQFKNEYTGDWASLTDHPSWSDSTEYRRKPRTININGHDVPEPVRESLDKEDEYYTISVSSKDAIATYSWNGDSVDCRLLRLGLIHLTREAAEIHAKALLSFTEKP